MSTENRPLRVFLCHARSDADLVRALYNRLTRDGVDVWLDKVSLIAGQDWEYEIPKAVRKSDVIIVCHSKQFNQQGFRQKEVRIALDAADYLPKGEIFIIPARLEECDVLDDLKRWQWVDLFEADSYDNLIRALRIRAENIGATLQVDRGWFPRVNKNSFFGRDINNINRVQKKHLNVGEESSLLSQTVVRWVLRIFLVVLIIATLILGNKALLLSSKPTAIIVATVPPTSPLTFTASISKSSYCYNGPSELYPVAEVVPADIKVTLLGMNSNGGDWFMVQNEDISRCWMEANALTIGDNVDLGKILLFITAITNDDTVCLVYPYPDQTVQTVIPKGWRISVYGKSDVDATWVLVVPHDSAELCWVEKKTLTGFPLTFLPIELPDSTLVPTITPTTTPTTTPTRRPP